nr:immunoglobulin heavy chain junction region [Mus musculus]
ITVQVRGMVTTVGTLT